MSDDDQVDPPAEDAEVRIAALQGRLTELEAQTRERMIRAEMKAQAIQAGMVDLDGLKFADTSGLTLDEAGEVRGADAAMASLRKAKPWLFGGTSTSSAAKRPPAEPPRSRLATDMTTKEWLTARAELLRRR
jgi:hypothetical protein